MKSWIAILTILFFTMLWGIGILLLLLVYYLLIIYNGGLVL